MAWIVPVKRNGSLRHHAPIQRRIGSYPAQPIVAVKHGGGSDRQRVGAITQSPEIIDAIPYQQIEPVGMHSKAMAQEGGGIQRMRKHLFLLPRTSDPVEAITRAHPKEQCIRRRGSGHATDHGPGRSCVPGSSHLVAASGSPHPALPGSARRFGHSSSSTDTSQVFSILSTSHLRQASWRQGLRSGRPAATAAPRGWQRSYH